MNTDLVFDLFGFEIILDERLTTTELDTLMKDYYQAYRALDDLLLGKLTAKDYLEILDASTIEVDTYFDNGMRNLQEIGIVI